MQLVVKPGRIDLRSPVGLMKEMNLLLASLRRVEVRIEPQTITDFLKWKNRMADYNGGRLPEGIAEQEQERNPYLRMTVAASRLDSSLEDVLALHQPFHLFFANHADSQLPRLIQLRSRFLARDDVIRLLAHRSRNLPTGVFDQLLGLVARVMRQRSGQHKRFARQRCPAFFLLACELTAALSSAA